jgi:hypothetical protein
MVCVLQKSYALKWPQIKISRLNEDPKSRQKYDKNKAIYKLSEKGHQRTDLFLLFF